ncbi:MAG: VOC family protein [Candidatus Nitrosoglobus sp.]|jgi:catechol 2,3-dioxygenase-like lactoylglutathione lyase family enzyme
MTDISANDLPHLIGLNHIALPVGNIDQALEFYGKLFDIRLRGRSSSHAFIDMGDQFIALFEDSAQGTDQKIRHVGLVVDSKEAVRERLKALEIPLLPGDFMDFLDPWGNRLQIVDYAEIQFTKAPEVLRGMGLVGLKKSLEAKRQLHDKGMVTE